MSFVLLTLTKKQEVDCIIRDTLDKVLVLRFGRSSDATCLQLDDILSKSSRDISKLGTIALVDVDAEEIQVYVKYFDITLIPSIVFFFNAHHMKMDSGTADHTKWLGSFQRKQDFIDVVEDKLSAMEEELGHQIHVFTNAAASPIPNEASAFSTDAMSDNVVARPYLRDDILSLNALELTSKPSELAPERKMEDSNSVPQPDLRPAPKKPTKPKWLKL